MITEETLRDGLALGEVAVATYEFSVGQVVGSQASASQVASRLFASSGALFCVSQASDEVPSHAEWLCADEAMGDPMGLSGDLFDELSGSMEALGALCGIDDALRGGVGDVALAMLDDVVAEGLLSVDDVVMLGAAIASGLLDGPSLAEVRDGIVSDRLFWEMFGPMLMRLMACGADTSWARSFVGSILHGDVSRYLVADFVMAYGQGLLSDGMLVDYARDVDGGKASWSTLCVAVHGRTEMVRLRR